jgi:hypothetical protein
MSARPDAEEGKTSEKLPHRICYITASDGRPLRGAGGGGILPIILCDDSIPRRAIAQERAIRPTLTP